LFVTLTLDDWGNVMGNNPIAVNFLNKFKFVKIYDWHILMIIDDNLSNFWDNGKNVMGKLVHERLKDKNKFQVEVLVLFTN
jgi:hypothetical protein